MIVFFLLVFAGCNTPKNEIAFIQIIGGSLESMSSMSISEVQLPGSEFYATTSGGIRVEVLVKDDQGAILDRLAEWTATAGDFDEKISRNTRYWPRVEGMHTVYAKVGEHRAEATVYTYNHQMIMSGSGSIDVEHAINFKEGVTDEPQNADMILLNQYHPGTPYYAEKNKIVFPNGFFPVQVTHLKEIEQAQIDESNWVYEYEYTFETEGLPLSGVIRNLDGSFTKINGWISSGPLNGEPDYLKFRFDYLVSGTTTFPY